VAASRRLAATSLGQLGRSWKAPCQPLQGPWVSSNECPVISLDALARAGLHRDYRRGGTRGSSWPDREISQRPRWLPPQSSE